MVPHDPSRGSLHFRPLPGAAFIVRVGYAFFAVLTLVIFLLVFVPVLLSIIAVLG